MSDGGLAIWEGCNRGRGPHGGALEPTELILPRHTGTRILSSPLAINNEAAIIITRARGTLIKQALRLSINKAKSELMLSLPRD